MLVLGKDNSISKTICVMQNIVSGISCLCQTKDARVSVKDVSARKKIFVIGKRCQWQEKYVSARQKMLVPGRSCYCKRLVLVQNKLLSGKRCQCQCKKCQWFCKRCQCQAEDVSVRTKDVSVSAKDISVRNQCYQCQEHGFHLMFQSRIN